jgi:cytochrome P450
MLPTGGGPNSTFPIPIPKGTVVAYSTYVLHRLPQIYGMDAEIFRPERWLEVGKLHGKLDLEATYLPFGAGTRSCLGSQCPVELREASNLLIHS